MHFCEASCDYRYNPDSLQEYDDHSPVLRRTKLGNLSFSDKIRSIVGQSYSQRQSRILHLRCYSSSAYGFVNTHRSSINSSRLNLFPFRFTEHRMSPRHIKVSCGHSVREWTNRTKHRLSLALLLLVYFSLDNCFLVSNQVSRNGLFVASADTIIDVDGSNRNDEFDFNDSNERASEVSENTDTRAINKADQEIKSETIENFAQVNVKNKHDEVNDDLYNTEDLSTVAFSGDEVAGTDGIMTSSDSITENSVGLKPPDIESSSNDSDNTKLQEISKSKKSFETDDLLQKATLNGKDFDDDNVETKASRHSINDDIETKAIGDGTVLFVDNGEANTGDATGGAPNNMFEQIWKNIQDQINKLQQQHQNMYYQVQNHKQQNDKQLKQSQQSQGQLFHYQLQQQQQQKQQKQLLQFVQFDGNQQVKQILEHFQAASPSSGHITSATATTEASTTAKRKYRQLNRFSTATTIIPGPGQFTYNRRTALYQQSVRNHYLNHQVLDTKEDVVQSTTTKTNTSSSSSSTSSFPLEAKNTSNTFLNAYNLYKNHDSAGHAFHHHWQQLWTTEQFTKPKYSPPAKHRTPLSSSSSTSSSSLSTRTKSIQRRQQQIKYQERWRTGHRLRDKKSSENEQKIHRQALHRQSSVLASAALSKKTESRSSSLHTSLLPFPQTMKLANKQLIQQMFQHGYDSYMYNAYPFGEIKPLTCKGTTFDLIQLDALTLIDALDSLLVIGNNCTEFARAVERLRYHHQSTPHGLFGVDKNVSVFETNIRVLGGLLSAHQLALAYQFDQVSSSSSSSQDFQKSKCSHRAAVLLSDVFDLDNGNVRWGNDNISKNNQDGQESINNQDGQNIINNQDGQKIILRKLLPPDTKEASHVHDYDEKAGEIPDLRVITNEDDNTVENGKESAYNSQVESLDNYVQSTKKSPPQDYSFDSFETDKLNMVMCSKVQNDIEIDDTFDSSLFRAFSGTVCKDPLSQISSPPKMTKKLTNKTKTSSSSSANSKSTKDQLWLYDGFLLELAEDIGSRLLPAFKSSKTGIPYGTVNLLYGVPSGETSVASVAGGGTLSMEFELLSRLTGDNQYGKAAKLASRAIWMRRSKAPLNLFGKHLDIHTGTWTETLSGIGSNSDSFLEYLAKQFFLFPEDVDFWAMLLTSYQGILDHSRHGEWYVDTDMSIGATHPNGHSRRILESLAAFYPGLQVLLGELTPASRTLNSMFMVREFVGFLPERFNFGFWKLDSLRDGAGIHPLRPELLESCYFMHRAARNVIHGSGSRLKKTHKSTVNGKQSDDMHVLLSSASSGWQWAADFALHKLNHTAHAQCGYATIRNMSPQITGSIDPSSSLGSDHSYSKLKYLSDEMPSFFLSETLKYLYLTFDDDDQSIIHSDADRDWIFTTEAHPFHYVPEKKKEKKIKKKAPSSTKITVDNTATSSSKHFNTELEKLKEILEMRLDRREKPQKKNRREHRNPRRHSGLRPSSNNLEKEKWTDQTNIKSFREGVEKSISISFNGRRKKFKRSINNGNDLISNGGLILTVPADQDDEQFLYVKQRSIIMGPYSESKQVHDKFHEKSSETNIAHLAFENLSFGSDLRTACPNIYSSKWMWIQALNGGSVDYSDMFVSVTTDILADHPMSVTTLGSAEALGALGTGLFLDEVDDMSGQSRPIIANTIPVEDSNVVADRSADATTAVEVASNSNNNGDSTEVIRVDSDVGLFEVTSFKDGSGFGLKREASHERILVNFLKGKSQERYEYTMIYSELLSKYSKVDDSVKLSSQGGDIGLNPHENTSVGKIQKNVVVGDFLGNMFSCTIEVIITRSDEGDFHTDDKMFTFPCAPAFFGPTKISKLVQIADLIELEAPIVEPSETNPTGCKQGTQNIHVSNDIPIAMLEASGSNQVDSLESMAHLPNKTESLESSCIGECFHMLRRGDCTFQEKIKNIMEKHKARGVIVVNSPEQDMFLMSIGSEGEDKKSKQQPDSLPLTVLVAHNDGNDIIKLITGVMDLKTTDSTEQSKRNVKAHISLRRRFGDVDESSGQVTNGDGDTNPALIDWPVVRVNPYAIQILAEYGWGVQAMQRKTSTLSDPIEWQLQLVRHTVQDENSDKQNNNDDEIEIDEDL